MMKLDLFVWLVSAFHLKAIVSPSLIVLLRTYTGTNRDHAITGVTESETKLKLALLN